MGFEYKNLEGPKAIESHMVVRPLSYSGGERGVMLSLTDLGSFKIENGSARHENVTILDAHQMIELVRVIDDVRERFPNHFNEVEAQMIQDKIDASNDERDRKLEEANRLILELTGDESKLIK